MREVTFSEYLEYVSECREIRIEDQVVPLIPINVKRLEPSESELTDVSTTVWSFPKRGSWATHRGDYRGNWAPQIPRALISMYTRPGETVLDPMVGGGTTLIEAKLLGRNSIGVDINYNATILTLHRLYYLEEALRKLGRARGGGLLKYFDNANSEGLQTGLREASLEDVERAWTRVYHGDARNLDKIEDESIDLITTHPPYFNIIKYGDREGVKGDLSKAKSLEEYLKWMGEIAAELYRVLKQDRYCAILIGDTRIRKHYVPLSHYVLQVFLNAGFTLKEEVIKVQHKMKTTREVWDRLKKRDFLLIYHEKLFILRKPASGEKIANIKYSGKLDFIKIEL